MERIHKGLALILFLCLVLGALVFFGFGSYMLFMDFYPISLYVVLGAIFFIGLCYVVGWGMEKYEKKIDEKTVELP